MRKETINNLKNEGYWFTLKELIRNKDDKSVDEAINLLEQLQLFYFFSEEEIRNMTSQIIYKENK